MAMASAEMGQYGDAVIGSIRHIDAAAGAAGGDLAERMTGNLQLYTGPALPHAVEGGRAHRVFQVR